jgi:Ni,Fe-hydrogenase III component G
MNGNTIYMKLKEEFNEAILSDVITNSNEQYVEVDAQRIREISIVISAELGCPLVSMFASDERPMNGHYAIYYAFAQRQEGQLFVIKTMHCPDDMRFQSICSIVHAAALYEREIQDMFGLVPMEHPDPRRLVFHSNWPEGQHPLRKDFDGRKKIERAKVEIPFKKVTGKSIESTSAILFEHPQPALIDLFKIAFSISSTLK